MKPFEASVVNIGYASITVPQEKFLADIAKAYKAGMALNSPHSIELATEIKETLLDDQIEVAANDALMDDTELKDIIINVGQSISETSVYLKSIFDNKCAMIQTFDLLEQCFQKYEDTDRSTDINHRAKKLKLMDKTNGDSSKTSENGIMCDECHLKDEEIQKLLKQNKFLGIVADSKITEEGILTPYGIDPDGTSANKIVLLKESELLYNFLKVYETCCMINSLHALKLAEQIKNGLGDLFIQPIETEGKECIMVDSKIQLKQKLNFLFVRIKRNDVFLDKICKNPSHRLNLFRNLMLLISSYSEDELNAEGGFATTQERLDDLDRKMELHKKVLQGKSIFDRLLEEE